MADDYTRTFATNGRPGPLRAVAHLGGRAAASALRPVNGAVNAALSAGVTIQRRAVDRVLDSPELERVMVEVVESQRVLTALEVAISSETANRLVDTFFDSGMFDRLVERLLASDGLWHLVDEIAQSPAVMAAVSQQGLTFADQVGDEVRNRSRRADDWLERAARRVIQRRNRQAQDTANVAGTEEPATVAGTTDSATVAGTAEPAIAPATPDPPAVPETPEPPAP